METNERDKEVAAKGEIQIDLSDWDFFHSSFAIHGESFMSFDPRRIPVGAEVGDVFEIVSERYGMKIRTLIRIKKNLHRA